MRWLIPRLDWGSWSGPAIGHDERLDRDRAELIDVAGFFVALAWLGLHAELCIAREHRAHPSPPGD